MDCVAYFFGGALLANVIPHLVNGMSGRAFPTPFARPSGRGESTAWFNVVWAALNLVAAYVLIVRVGGFDIRSFAHVGAAATGAFLLAIGSAWHFGAQYGGNRGRQRPEP